MRIAPLLAALSLAALPAACAAPRPDAPLTAQYDGRPFSYWVRRLTDLKPEPSMEAGMALCHFGDAALPALREGLHSSTPHVRKSASTALYNMACEIRNAPGVVPVLLEGTESEDREVRYLVLSALASMRPVVPEAEAALRRALEDPSPRVRWIAERGLKWLSGEADVGISWDHKPPEE